MTVADPLVKLALGGDAKAALELGTLCLGSAPADQASARLWFERAAGRGNAVAAYNLGRFAAKGIAGPIDGQEAARRFAEAADRGYAEAQYSLALLLLAGRDTPQDIARARELLQKAGAQGHASARRLLDDLKPQAMLGSPTLLNP